MANITDTRVDATQAPSAEAWTTAELVGAQGMPALDGHKRSRVEVVATLAIVGLPFVGLVVAVERLWGHGVSLRDLVLAAVFYAVVGHGATVGFHRLFSHRAFKAARPLKVALAVAGSMAFEGSLVSWVDNHRRHHAFSDKAGDPHSPVGAPGTLRGLWHAHMGWLFTDVGDGRHRTADLLRDRDLVVVDRLFPLWCAISLALPFGIGWALGGSIGFGLTALLWAGAVRICVLHHVTWSINSICHTFGRRPFDTDDRSMNFAPLALLSMGESWHNSHHAWPRAARHGRGRMQLDSSAAVIEGFARLGWVTDVKHAVASAPRP